MSWNRKVSAERIKKAAQDIAKVEIVPMVRETDLTTIPITKAYWVDGVHTYVDFPNALSLLGSADQEEGERYHKRLLRFLHIYQRVAQVVLRATDAVKVDFQNQRLHVVLYKPYDSAQKRIAAAVAVADLLLRVIVEANELHEELRDARVCVGAESGLALAVNNGTRGDREPLFLGNPANFAAKLLVSGMTGIFLGPEARAEFGPAWTLKNPAGAPLSSDQLETCRKLAGLNISPEQLVRLWKEELRTTPLADFQFKRPTPPLKDLDLETLTPANSRRLEAVVITADVDGFTRFIAELTAKGDAATAVRVLHVIRKELRDVLNDFGGRKIRYVGDCIVGVLADGATSTDLPATVTGGVLCAAAMRDAFESIQQELPAAKPLGLAVGLEVGPVSITRLGMKGARDRCMVGRAVAGSQRVQEACSGQHTGLGPNAYQAATPTIQSLFPGGKPQTGITYNRVAALLEAAGDQTLRSFGVIEGAPNIIIPRAHTA